MLPVPEYVHIRNLYHKVKCFSPCLHIANYHLVHTTDQRIELRVFQKRLQQCPMCSAHHHNAALCNTFYCFNLSRFG